MTPPKRERNKGGRRGGRRGGREGREAREPPSYEPVRDAPKHSPEDSAPQSLDPPQSEFKEKRFPYKNRQPQQLHTTETKLPAKSPRQESTTEQSTTTTTAAKPNEAPRSRGWETAPPLEKFQKSSIKAPPGGMGRGKPLSNQKNPAHNKFSLLASEEN